LLLGLLAGERRAFLARIRVDVSSSPPSFFFFFSIFFFVRCFFFAFSPLARAAIFAFRTSEGTYPQAKTKNALDC
jgi:hypothetical protein